MRLHALMPLAAMLTLTLAGCWNWGSTPPAETPDGTLSPVRGSATFKVVNLVLRNGIADFNARDVVVYWDEHTVFLRDGKVFRGDVAPKAGDAFDFRGLEAHQEIALELVELK